MIVDLKNPIFNNDSYDAVFKLNETTLLIGDKPTTVYDIGLSGTHQSSVYTDLDGLLKLQCALNNFINSKDFSKDVK